VLFFGDLSTREFAIRDGCISNLSDLLIFVIYGFSATLFVAIGLLVRKKMAQQPTPKE
jgi:hypothetical protein